MAYINLFKYQNRKEIPNASNKLHLENLAGKIITLLYKYFLLSSNFFQISFKFIASKDIYIYFNLPSSILIVYQRIRKKRSILLTILQIRTSKNK